MLEIIARKLTRDEIEFLKKNGGALDTLLSWHQRIAALEDELAKAEAVVPRTEARLKQARDDLKRHEKDRAAKTRDAWRWGQKRTELLDAVDELVGKLEAERQHAEKYMPSQVERARADGPEGLRRAAPAFGRVGAH